MESIKSTRSPNAHVPSRCELAWRDCLDKLANASTDLFTPESVYRVMVDWAEDLHRRGEADKHKLQKLAAERLGV